jgi:hypothetical protein
MLTKALSSPIAAPCWTTTAKSRWAKPMAVLLFWICEPVLLACVSI